MAERLSLEELARRTGEPAERLLKWREAGLLGREDGEGFDPRDVGRARVIHDLLHYGISLDDIVKGAADPNSVICRFLDEMGARYSNRTYTFEQIVNLVVIDPELARRLIDAAGIEDPGDMFGPEDIQFFRSCKVALEAGMAEEALLQVLRVYSDAMSRAADVGSRASHFYMHRKLVDEGRTAQEIMEKLDEAGRRIEPLVEPALIYFYRKGVARAEWEDMLMHLEEEMGLAERPEIPGQIRRGIMFVDLASFTPLAEAMGDAKAAEILEQFAGMVRTAVRRCHGRIVKQIGDGFMIVFSDPFSAISCALELDERVSAQPQFPAVRSALHWGPVLYRDGDYLGSNVNIASRLASEAGRHQVLVTGEVWKRVKDHEGLQFVRLGKRRLKGLAAEVEVFEVRHAAPEGAQRVIDPVCGMEISVSEATARLTIGGRERWFCTEECLRQFVASPERYGP